MQGARATSPESSAPSLPHVGGAATAPRTPRSPLHVIGDLTLGMPSLSPRLAPPLDDRGGRLAGDVRPVRRAAPPPAVVGGVSRLHRSLHAYESSQVRAAQRGQGD